MPTRGRLDPKWTSAVADSLYGSGTTINDLVQEWTNNLAAEYSEDHLWLGHCWASQEDCDRFVHWLESQGLHPMRF